MMFAGATPALPQEGPVITAPTEVAPGIPIAPGFLFELENAPESLKEIPIWNEIEKMLDRPYAFTSSPVEGNPQGWPSYRSTLPRRRSFLPAGCDYNPATAPPPCNDALLEPFLIQPLNYNYMNGEELRLLNPDYEGGPFHIPSELVQCGVGNDNESAFCGVATTANSVNGPVFSPANDPNRWVWIYEEQDISPGDDRVEGTSIDFNSPIRPDVATPTTTFAPKYANLACIVTTELVPPEGTILCGGDPGEPGYLGFGRLGNARQRDDQYSTPAVPLNINGAQTAPGGDVANPGPGTVLSTARRLVDPAGCGERNSTLGGAGSCTGQGVIQRLLKPTLKANPNSQNPQYTANSLANLSGQEDALAPSNENDYVRNRDAAIVLGKSLFWDMQVGSDGVQACGTCHFAAGADNRIRNQVNPNHVGIPIDHSFQVAEPNEEVEASDFPLNPGGDVRGANDVVSSMGVHFGLFDDIPPIGSFVTNSSGVQVLPTDLRKPHEDGGDVDPIAGFAGDSETNDFRRVEPRNTPTIFMAAFNFDNFWDGRARHDFNGGSVFGASDPGHHVFTSTTLVSPIVPTRQIIRFASLASLATGPALSEFEMSFLGRNWPKIGKKLLQAGVTPLGNQLVDRTDSVLGLYSNQGGSACGTLPIADRSASWSASGAPSKPGLCISYPALIRLAFYPDLWRNPLGGSFFQGRHLNGCYTDGRLPACGAGISDPFDSYVLTPAAGQATASSTNQFNLMEANFSLFFGLSFHLWGTILIPDDAPFDRFFEANPDAFKNVGEANEPGLVWDMPSCSQNGGVQPCFTEVGPFKRTPGIPLNLESGPSVTVGTRGPTDPDPLLGIDFFYGFNLTGKNPDFRTARCGECHVGGVTTDHTVVTSNQLSFGDFIVEFAVPGAEIPIEPLGRSRIITGFSLEGELFDNAQDAIEARIINQAIESNPDDGLSYPDGRAFFDNGLYNLGVTPCVADGVGTADCTDVGRGGNDAFGWPLSLSALMLMNLEEGAVPEVALTSFDPDSPSGDLFEPTAQDQFINPGSEEEPADPKLPPYLAPWASHIPVGDEVQQDEAGGGGASMANTLQEVPLLEGFVDTLGPFNPAGTIGENYNNAPEILMGTWPTPNRVGRFGSFKAPAIRNVELTAPYFHNGGKLTLAQVVDFYSRGGDFPTTNAHHRDFNIVNFANDIQTLGQLPAGYPSAEEFEKALVDLLLAFTDERVRNEQAPFDHPEIFAPLDGTAPENTFGRPGFLAGLTGDCDGEGPSTDACFLHAPAVGAAGGPAVRGFLGVEVGDRNNPNCSASAGPISHYCVTTN
jgi:cytochrome c peroxidase